jgi:hypothetical protein
VYTQPNRAGRAAGSGSDVLSTVYDDLTDEELRDAVRRLDTGT